MTLLQTPLESWHVNGLEVVVTAVGEGPLVVLAHGFPDLAVTWRHQVPALVDAGYRVIAPDMRGYGQSERPTEVSAYGIRTVGLDLIGLLEHEGVAQAHFIGHDWGAACVWQLGLDHPGSVLSLTGVSVPYALPAPAEPTSILRARWGDDFYQLRLQRTGVAEMTLIRDIEHTLAAIFGDRYDLIETEETIAPPEWIPPDLFAHYVRVFGRTGFSGGLNYYRNIDDNWAATRSIGEPVIHHRSLFITGSADPVSTFMRVDGSTRAFKDLTTLVVDGAGHWVHQESPQSVNDALVEHLHRQSAPHQLR